MIDYAKAMANVNNYAKKNDNFYVEFYKLPENEGNLLGRYIKSISRPTLDLIANEYRHRGGTYKDKGNVTLGPISVVFVDDSDGLVNLVIYAQTIRQINKHSDLYGRVQWPDMDREYKFDIKYKLFNADKKVVEEYILRRCFITSVGHSSSMFADSSDNEITVTIDYDDLEIPHLDDYLAYLGAAKVPSALK